MAAPVVRVLFVCLGNICRSPLAEGVFRHLVEEAELAQQFEIDSAGTSGYHTGDPPDPRTTEVAARRGVTLAGESRQITRSDVERYDYLIVMDAHNESEVRRLAASVDPGIEVRRLLSFDPEAGGDLDVPDPYYGGPDGFERVHDMVERACRGLLDHIRQQHGL
jgi:protein-tyrosine phosphatase